jgi:hypothetical protein
MLLVVIMDDDDNICAICLEACKDTYETPCHHKFCDGCIRKVPRTRQEKEGVMMVGVDCPLCRGFVVITGDNQHNFICVNICYRVFLCVSVGMIGGAGSVFIYIFFNTTNIIEPAGMNNYSLGLAIFTGIIIFWVIGIMGIIRRRICGIDI